MAPPRSAIRGVGRILRREPRHGLRLLWMIHRLRQLERDRWEQGDPMDSDERIEFIERAIPGLRSR